MTMLTIIYIVGVLIGLGVMRDPWPGRVGTALAWPLGPAAFVVVVSVMLVAATLLWPLVMLPLGALFAALVWGLT
jgi:hypothetical protein